jgi:hypothetical protein
MEAPVGHRAASTALTTIILALMTTGSINVKADSVSPLTMSFPRGCLQFHTAPAVSCLFRWYLAHLGCRATECVTLHVTN